MDPVVMIGMPVYRDVPVPTVLSLLSTVSFLRRKNLSYGVAMPFGESVVSSARNRTATIFLGSDCTHLFTIDADMTWEAEDFYKVLMLGCKYPVVGATYTTKTEPSVFMVDPETEEPDDEGCILASGLGLGFTCVQRQVIERLAESSTVGELLSDNMQKIKVHEIYRNDNKGEDKVFFRDVIDMGYEVRVCVGVSPGHIGTKIFRGNFAKALEDERNQRIRHIDEPRRLQARG
jgi:hypothetical protein